MKLPKLKQLTKERLSPAALFLILICFFEALSLIIAFALPEYGLADLLFVNRENSFMDYFHSVMTFEHYSLRNLYYSGKMFYPPLATLFYLIMYRLIPSGAMPETDFLARERQAAAVPFLLLTVLLSIGVIYILHAMRRGTDLENKLFAITMLLSAPMLYQYDRGNIIFLTLLLVLIFFHWKDAESPVKRELALICLALATGLKIYPVLFGVVLLFEKRWKSALRCCVYGLLAFFLPALVFGGVSPLDIIENVFRTSTGAQGEGFGYKINYSNTFAILCSALRIPHTRNVLNVLSCVLGVLVALSAFVHRKGWKLIGTLTLLVVALPGFSYVYSLIFMTIPAVCFLNEHQSTPARAKDFIYAFLLACCFIPLPFTGTAYSVYYPGYPLTTTTFAESLAVLIISLMLVVDAAIVLYRKRKSLREAKDTASV